MNFSFYSQNMVSLTIVHHLLWVDSAFRRKHYMCEVKYNGFCGYLLILWMCSNDINRCKVCEQHKMWLLYLFYLIRNWIKYSVLVFISVVLPATHTECVSINSVPIVCCVCVCVECGNRCEIELRKCSSAQNTLTLELFRSKEQVDVEKLTQTTCHWIKYSISSVNVTIECFYKLFGDWNQKHARQLQFLHVNYMQNPYV